MYKSESKIKRGHSIHNYIFSPLNYRTVQDYAHCSLSFTFFKDVDTLDLSACSILHDPLASRLDSAFQGWCSITCAILVLMNMLAKAATALRDKLVAWTPTSMPLVKSLRSYCFHDFAEWLHTNPHCSCEHIHFYALCTSQFSNCTLPHHVLYLFPKSS